MVRRVCTQGLIRWDSHQAKKQRVDGTGTGTWHGTELEPCYHSDGLAIVGLTIVAEVGRSRRCMYQLCMFWACCAHWDHCRVVIGLMCGQGY